MNSRLILKEAAFAVLNAAKKIAGTNAAQTRVAVVGGFAVTEMTKHRRTKVHNITTAFLSFVNQLLMKMFQDVDLFFGGELVPTKLKKQLHQVDRAFTINAEAFNGVTYRSPISRVITKVDLIDAEVVS